MMSRVDRLRTGVTRWAARLAERRAEHAAGGDVSLEPSEAERESAGTTGLQALGSGGGTGEPAAGSTGRPQVPAPPAVETRPAPASVVPWGMRVASEAGWRLLVLAGVVWVLIQVISSLSLLILAFSAGLLITALLQPTVARLKRIGLGKGLATTITFITGFVVMGLVGWFVVWQVINNLPTLTERVQDGIDELQKWAVSGPFHVSESQVNDMAKTVSDWLGNNSKEVTTAGLEGVTAIFEFLSGALLAMFVTLFLLYDGRTIWSWTLGFVPRAARAGVAGAGPRAWITLTGYVRGTVIVALIDAIFIGVGLAVLDVPMAVPLAVFVFLFAFIPIIGAVLSGALAVLVALVTNGIVTALMVLAVVLIVQQLESHVLQPLIMSRLVRVHPLAVVFAVTGGSLIAGIPGAVVSVPLVAVLNTVVGYLRRFADEPAFRRKSVAASGTGGTPGAGEPGTSARSFDNS